MIDTKLLEILACPFCRGDVEYDAKGSKLICVECNRKYPVKNGIPVMLLDQADTSEAKLPNAEITDEGIIQGIDEDEISVDK